MKTVPRFGLSAVEVVGVTTCLMILWGVVSPWLQVVRNDARSILCQQRVSRLTLAALCYESAQGHLPHARWQYDVLPFADLQLTRDAIDTGTEPPEFWAFRCPADQLPTWQDYYPVAAPDYLLGSYLGCSGVQPDQGRWDGVFDPNASEFPGGRAPTALREITDGLGVTALFGESLMASFDFDASARMRVLWVPPQTSGARGDGLVELVRRCATIPADPPAVGWSGRADFKGKLFELAESLDGTRWNYASSVGIGINLYNHANVPQTASLWGNSRRGGQVSVAASSGHGNVNVGFCDGHTQPFDGSVDLQVWRQLGRRERPAE